jgi:hypothetical protein
MAASPQTGPGTCFKNQNYEIQGNPCNHCGCHAFWMAKVEKRKGTMAQAKKFAAAAASQKEEGSGRNFFGL